MKHILEKLGKTSILVIGDIMLDKYIWGNVSRISQEAPVPIVDVHDEYHSPGGAANTANNIASLGGNCYLMGIIGNDQAAKILMKEISKTKIDTSNIIMEDNYKTTRKVRIIGNNHQLLRIDYESKEYISRKLEQKFVSLMKNAIKQVDAVIISDYAKGMITKTLMDRVRVLAGKKIIIVDPKPKHKLFYRDVNLITPNNREACAMLKMEISNCENIKHIGTELARELNTNVLITRGEKGMTLFDSTNISDIPTVAKEVYDVSGAGDTVAGAIGLALAAGASMQDAATIANHAAGIVVGKRGTATPTIEELRKSLKDE